MIQHDIVAVEGEFQVRRVDTKLIGRFGDMPNFSAVAVTKDATELGSVAFHRAAAPAVPRLVSGCSLS